MSQNKAPNQSKPIKNIEVGKFYFIHDGSKTGHPGYVVWKDDQTNLYLAIKFGTSYNEHNYKFDRPLGKKAKASYVYKRLFLGKRKDFDKRILDDMFLTDEESKNILNQMDYLNPVYSSNINRKNKRYYKWRFRQK